MKLLEKAKPEIQALDKYISSTLSNKEKEELSFLLEKVYSPHI